MKLDAVVVLNTMWGDSAKAVAPRWFSINPDNKSGKLLYKLLGTKKFVVTNACKELVTNPNQQGKPDPNWLAHNLTLLLAYDYRMLLVCGKSTWNTYKLSGFDPNLGQVKRRVFKMKHPAARNWTKQEIARWRDYLK